MDQTAPKSSSRQEDATPRAVPEKTAHGRPLADYLVLLGLAVAVPALVFSGYLLYRFADTERQSANDSAYDAAMSIRDAADREIASMSTTLKVLATSTELEAGNYALFHERAEAGLRGTQSYVALADPAYRVLVSTRVPYGEPLFPVGDRQSVDEPLKSGHTYVSDVFVSRRTGKPVFNISLPIKVKGAPFVLIMTRDAESFRQIINDLQLPPGWATTLMDRAGTVVAGTGDEEVGAPSKFSVLPGGGNVEPTRVDVNGQTIVYAIRRSFDTGWRAASWVPESVISAPLWNQVSLLLLAGAALLALTALLAFWFARRVSEPILALASQARSVGLGEAIAPLTSRIREANEVSRTLAAAAAERLRSEDQIRFLMRELSHRAKNQLAVVTAMARRTGGASETMEEFQAVFSERLLALSRSMDLLVRENWGGVPLDELVQAHLQPFETGASGRIVLKGPRISLNPEAAQNLGLAFHELATNAAKYGALSVPEGKVKIRWRPVEGDESRFQIYWIERGGPKVEAPTRDGFGSFVIQRSVAQALHGEVKHEFRPTGVRWMLTLSRESIEAGSRRRDRSPSSTPA